MKILIPAMLVIFLSVGVDAQISISNTKWMVHTEVPQPRGLLLDFKKDTLRIFNEQGVETSSAIFLQRNDSILFRKLSGISRCPVGSEGWYRIEWFENGEKFFFRRINDSCAFRVYDQFKVIRKIKEPN